MSRTSRMDEAPAGEVRERILCAASDLFYAEGARAVGVDLVIARAGVAKTSLYRHFRSKDELIAAFLDREDRAFWDQWERVSHRHPADARAELDAHMGWIAERVGRPKYRGCPQLNMAAEFPDDAHPARVVAIAHKREMLRRLEGIGERLGVARPRPLAVRLLLLVNGAFVSPAIVAAEGAEAVLLSASHALIAAAEQDARSPSPESARRADRSRAS